MSAKKRTEYLILVQKIIEKRLEEMRFNIAEYADFLENQRILWYRERQQYLHDPSRVADLLASRLPDRSEEIKTVIHQLQEIILYHYDHYWSSFLQTMLLRRDGIHMVRMGGFQPLRIFREEADTFFEDMLESCRQVVVNACISWLDQPSVESKQHSYRRPSSTWTYIASDNPFSDQLNIRLANPGEIALQTDVLTLPLLFIKGLISRWKGRRKDGVDI
jgi:preprotein translocase subunit SecA